jgi:AMP nucleosidase
MKNQSYDAIRDQQSFEDAEAAVDRISEIYAEGCTLLGRHFERFAAGEQDLAKVDACYPYLSIEVASLGAGSRGGRSYGSVSEAGLYGTTITHPALFRTYLVEQIRLLMENHSVPVRVGISNRQIPLTFATEQLTSDLAAEEVPRLADMFHLPDLAKIDDAIADGTYRPGDGEAKPLALFPAERVDYSLSRLRHYSGTAPEHFQRFVLFTNYQRYVDEFIDFGRKEVTDGEVYRAFVEPGNAMMCNPRLTDRPPSGEALLKLPQMPAYHLVKDGHMGITLVNIGVGPSNAKTITDHVAVLRQIGRAHV